MRNYLTLHTGFVSIAAEMGYRTKRTSRSISCSNVNYVQSEAIRKSPNYEIKDEQNLSYVEGEELIETSSTKYRQKESTRG